MNIVYAYVIVSSFVVLFTLFLIIIECRIDKRLISIIKEVGEKESSTEYSELKIIEIPDAIDRKLLIKNIY